MMNKLLSALFVLLPLSLWAQNWDVIQNSGDYYYGVGNGKTESEAMEMAMSELTNMIVVHVSNDFQGLTDETNRNGIVDHQSKVLNCVKSYSQATLTNVEKWLIGKEPNITMRCFMKKSELARIYEGRIAKAKDMMTSAAEFLEKRKVDMALQYYYWAYSLIRSVQRPNEVNDEQGRLLINTLPLKITDILDDISVSIESREDDNVNLLFLYQGKPVSSLDYTYSDGRATCYGTAKDGRGLMQMISDYEPSAYHIEIDYEYKGQAQGDAEMHSVLNVIGKKIFPKASKTLSRQSVTGNNSSQTSENAEGFHLTPRTSQLELNNSKLAEVVGKVICAIQNRRYSDANPYFTQEGLEMYNKLITYGTGRVVGKPDIHFFKGLNGNTVARGVQMSFSFTSGTKKTFVEDVALTLNKEGKICGVAFGLGQIAENDILCRKASGWSDETRELLMEFLESYKTAYCLKRMDYIRDVFADDAIIIIGNVTKRKGMPKGQQERSFSIEGQDIITTNRYSKDEYLRNLERCFKRNEFINIRFTNNDIQWLEKYRDRADMKELFAIQIGQEYNSTTYGDRGYLFLLVNLTDHSQPQIQVRTWQPNAVDLKKVYNAGDFYDN